MGFWKDLFAVPTAPAPAAPVEDLPETSYESKEYGLAFTVPAGTKLFTAGTPDAAKHRVAADTPMVIVNPTVADENITIKVDDGVGEGDLAEYKAMLDRTPNMPLPRYKRVSVRSCTLGKQGDKPAVEHIHFLKGTCYGKLRQVSFSHEGRGFTVTCGTREERFDAANSSFFETMLASLEFRPLMNRGDLRMVALANWPVVALPQALDSLVQMLQSAPQPRYRVGPHPDRSKKRSQCFLSDDFVDANEDLSPRLVALAERVDPNSILAELQQLMAGAARHTPVTDVGEMASDPKHLVLRTSAGASVVVDRVRFDYLRAVRPSCKVLLLLPARAVVALVSDGNDGLLVTSSA
jgi:hypothetical protein